MSTRSCCPPQLILVGSLAFVFVSLLINVVSGIYEILSDKALQRKIRDIPSEHIDPDKKWLHAIIILFIISYSSGIFILLVMACRKSYYTVEGYKTKEDFSEKQRQIQKTISAMQSCVVFMGIYKTIVYGSILNKLRAEGIWHGSQDWTLDSFLVVIPYFGTRHEDEWTIEYLLKANITITCFNIFKTCVLYIPAVAADHSSLVKKFFIQVGLIFPSIFIVAIIGVKSVSATMVLHYIQRYFTDQQIFHTTHSLDVAIVGALFGGTLISSLINWAAYLLEYTLKHKSLPSRAHYVVNTARTLTHLLKQEKDPFGSMDGQLAPGIFTNIVTSIFALISLSTTLAVHDQTHVWNYYFIVDICYSSVIFVFFFVLNCCVCCAKPDRDYEEFNLIAPGEA